MSSVAITELLRAWREGLDVGPRQALEREIYATLKRMATGRWRDAGSPRTLSPTALVHEAMARLLDAGVDWNSRMHFYALAALQMRAVLVDAARRRNAEKRGAGVAPVTLDGVELGVSTDAALLDLDRALSELAREEARAARVIELTYFGGMSAREVATALGVGVTTIETDLAYGRAWLRARLAA
jgi:RNA polymerase sigma factor (TIGR02999 family)